MASPLVGADSAAVEDASGLQASAVSRAGPAREGNEDHYGWLPPDAGDPGRGWLFAVADGVGGAAAGERASDVAVATLLETYASTPGDPAERLQRAAVAAHQAVVGLGDSASELSGTATTLTAAAVAGDRLAILHAGDSRAYLLRDGMLAPLTQDHTWVASQVELGRMLPEDAWNHPLRGVITRCLGQLEPLEFDVIRRLLQPGDRLLLCTDGLTDAVPQRDLAAAALRGSPAEAVQRLIDLARAKDHTDDATALIVQIPEQGQGTRKRVAGAKGHEIAGSPASPLSISAGERVPTGPGARPMGAADPFGLRRLRAPGALASRRATLAGLAASAAAVGLAAGGIVAAARLLRAGGRGPEGAAEAFLRSWEQQRYDAMWELVATGTDVSRDEFSRHYEQAAARAGITGVQARLKSAPVDTRGKHRVALAFRARITTQRVGAIEQSNQLPLVWEPGPNLRTPFPGSERSSLSPPRVGVGDGLGERFAFIWRRLRGLPDQETGRWAVEWAPSLIFAELQAGHTLRLVADRPRRAPVLSADGAAVADQSTRPEVGVVPGRVRDEPRLLDALSRALGLPPERVRAAYAAGRPDWYMPVAPLPPGAPPEVLAELRALPGILLRDQPVRHYPEPSMAHVVGYTGAITADELARLAAEGYGPADVIGKSGIERWAERTLAGAPGARLEVVNPQGAATATLGTSVPPQSGKAARLTISAQLQRVAAEALGDRPGAVVALDPRDGAVRALVSHPSFDANALSQGQPAVWQAVQTDPRHPLFNRATLGAYPIGSVFKIVTIAAGLEHGGFRPDSGFVCTGRWTGLGEQWAMYCWLRSGHGRIDLYQGLVQSCDVVFYEIGKRLDEVDPNLLPSMARAFGFGAPAGLEELAEAAGAVPGPEWKRQALREPWVRGDAVNLAIGQGHFQATPLQVARAVAAVATGGFPCPMLVGGYEAPGGALEPRQPRCDRPALGVRPEHLATIRAALRDVVAGARGTAAGAFRGSSVAAAGKTGTAESGQEQPHAWFAGYAPHDAPRLVVVAVVEHAGEGSQVAAPIVRRVLEAGIEAT